MAYITGQDASGVRQIANGRLFLDLGPILDEVKTRLGEQGIALAARILAVSSSIELPVANVAYLEETKSAVKLLNTLAYVLPWVAALCFIGAVRCRATVGGRWCGRGC